MPRAFTRFLTCGPALLLGCGLAVATGQELEVSSGERLTVDLETGAQLKISGWDRDAVSVDAEFTGRDADAVVFDVRRTKGGVTITSRFSEQRHHMATGGTVHVRVPKRFDLRLESMGGKIEIEDVLGEIRGETMGGELDLRRLGGRIELTTMGGDIGLLDSDVDGKLQTYGGNVRLARVRGNVEAETMGGEVIYEDVEATGSESEVKIRTMGGNISAPDAPNGADLETMGGNISIGRAGGFLKAETLGGNISADAVDGWIRATTMGGRIRVVMVGDPRNGRRDVRLISMGGDISLTVPADLSMEVDIALVYTKKSRQRFEIRSDFPLQIGETPNWEYESGSPQKSIYGKGTIGSGEHKIKIETINGDVELLRGK